MPSLPFNIYSLILARKADLYYDCKKAAGKIIFLEDAVDGSVRQVALFTETSGRWTLDCKVVNNNIPQKVILASCQLVHPSASEL